MTGSPAVGGGVLLLGPVYRDSVDASPRRVSHPSRGPSLARASHPGLQDQFARPFRCLRAPRWDRGHTTRRRSDLRRMSVFGYARGWPPGRSDRSRGRAPPSRSRGSRQPTAGSHRRSNTDLRLARPVGRPAATVAEEGYTEPTPVQAAAIPLVLEGRDVLAAAQTGTGKTAAFTLPILDRLRGHANTSFSPARHPVRALILVPTRELAVQVDEAVRTYGRTVPFARPSSTAACRWSPQIKALPSRRRDPVATPGRLLDLVGQRVANLGQVEILVLDEADRMLDMGFLPDIQGSSSCCRSAARTSCSRRRSLTTSGGCPARSCVTRRPSRSRRATLPPRRSASSSTRSIATAKRSSSPT